MGWACEENGRDWFDWSGQCAGEPWNVGMEDGDEVFLQVGFGGDVYLRGGWLGVGAGIEDDYGGGGEG
jgi:hypothetical protein